MANKKSSGVRNSERQNGKAWKKRKKVNTNTGKTVGGYSPAKLQLRAKKKANPKVQTDSSHTVDADNSFGKVTIVRSVKNYEEGKDSGSNT